MTKKTERREKSGCIWRFMNIFTFRHQHQQSLPHKLLLLNCNHHHHHHHHVSIRNTELDKSTCRRRHKDPQDNLTSVKKLIAQELFSDKTLKEHLEIAKAEDSQRRRRKAHRRKNKTSCSCSNKNHHGSLDIDNMIEDFYSQIHPRRVQQDYKEKVRRLVKFLISQKLLQGGNHPHPTLTSKDLMQVFQILGSDEELFLKLLQDPEILVPSCQKGEESLTLTQQSSLAYTRWLSNTDTSQEVNFSSPHTGLYNHYHGLSKNERNRSSSVLFVSEIKRKLKQAILRKGLLGTKDHFFIERMAKPTVPSSIYTEAKKRLSQMLNNRDLHSNSTTTQVHTTTLATILSLPQEDSPSSSPGHRKSPSEDFINIKKESHASQGENAAENSIQPTPSDIQDGTANEDKISCAVDVMIINEREACSTLAHDEQISHEEEEVAFSLANSKSSITHLSKWLSPISVLEPLLHEDDDDDDIIAPKMLSQSDEQPWCIHFDPSEKGDKELVFEYVGAVLDVADSDYEELYLKAQFTDQLLEPALISNIPFYPNQLCTDHELLFDCINEVLVELCCCSPWTRVKGIIQERVYWHLLPLPLPHTLDQIVRKDMTKAGNWLDIRCDIDSIAFETTELILEGLLEELSSS